MSLVNPRTLVLAGHGMVGQKLLEVLASRDAGTTWRVVVLAEEPRPAYDRVRLSALFAGATEADLALGDGTVLAAPWVELALGDPVVSIDRAARTVMTRDGRAQAYDALVLATGSSPFVPPIPGIDRPGCFVYRTIEDLDAIRSHAVGCRAGAVIGGGLLGLEAANALRELGLETHVVEAAPRLMPVQVDEGGGAVLRHRIEQLGVHVRTDARTAEAVGGAGGAVRGLRFEDGEVLDVGIVVVSAGIRPRDELARACGLEVGERGGVTVDETCRTADPAVWAIGECAHVAGRTWGLVAPGYDMARVVADRLLGGDAAFTAGDLSTKLKLLGVDVASIGDAHGTATPGAQAVTLHDPVRAVHRRVVVGADGRLVGAVLVGDASSYTTLLSMARGDLPTPERPEQLLVEPASAAGASAPGAAALAPGALVCSCNGVTKGAICAAIVEHELTGVDGVKALTTAGTGCGGCTPVLTELLAHERRRAGHEVPDHLCEHFPWSRPELFDIVRLKGIRTFADLVGAYGTGRGCEVCKPAVASMLASLGSGHILDGEQASLQDTNDFALANLQRDGTYSVVPRVPGGEITPRQLVVIGEVAQDFGLYTKITGGQRIDLFGATLDQLPAIWARLVDAGMESGHAYGKALRTVKSCVGLTWCRYGVQDSTTLAIDLETRYRGLRAPHKIKMAVSGCTRECAEAQNKDVGVIATEKGWNLYVAGNGGMRPAHAVLLAEGLDTETLVRTIDRFLAFYIRTADRLERTATWFAKLDGGIDHLRRVVLDDALGLAEELEADIARHVAGYECEWAAVLADPARLARFRTFVNSDEPDPTVVRVLERGQPRPARAGEAAGAPVTIRLGPTRAGRGAAAGVGVTA